MINKIWNWIKELITPHRQDEHLEFYEEIKPKPQHCNKHNRYRKNCLSCREAIA